MNAKELADVIDVVESISGQAELYGHEIATERVCEAVEKLKKLIPRYRLPQPSDDGKWCFLEELPSDAPPTLVRTVSQVVDCDAQLLAYQFWTVAGWRELTGNVWPCERPEGGGT